MRIRASRSVVFYYLFHCYCISVMSTLHPSSSLSSPRSLSFSSYPFHVDCFPRVPSRYITHRHMQIIRSSPWSCNNTDTRFYFAFLGLVDALREDMLPPEIHGRSNAFRRACRVHDCVLHARLRAVQRSARRSSTSRSYFIFPCESASDVLAAWENLPVFCTLRPPIRIHSSGPLSRLCLR